MFEYLPLFAFQAGFVAAGLTILYRMLGGRAFAAFESKGVESRRQLARRIANN